MNKQQKITISIVAALVLVGGAVIFLHTPTTPSSATNTDTSSDQYATSILACYPESAGQPIPNNSIQNVKETSRIYINMPKNFYPQDLEGSWTTVEGNATAGSVGGGFGEAEGATSGCWSSYVDFEGTGEVHLRVKSTVNGAPDYFVRFIVSPV